LEELEVLAAATTSATDRRPPASPPLHGHVSVVGYGENGYPGHSVDPSRPGVPMTSPTTEPTHDALNDPVDHLRITHEQLAILRSVLPLEELPVDPRIREHAVEVGERGPETLAGAVALQTFTAPKLERTTAYRFQRRGILNEHLFHAWPASGYDYPALTTVIFEMNGAIILGADLIPIADVAFYREYYGRWYAEHTDLVREFWPRLTPFLRTQSPPPDAYFTNQLGSRLAVLTDLSPDAMPVALDYVRELTRLWTTLWSRAEPTPEIHRDHVEARRKALMTRAYKGLDYHSPASPSLASVIGWTGANLMFDHVFGPDDPDQGLDTRRTYLDVEVSPGTEARQANRSS
jgi:hypothetical protein